MPHMIENLQWVLTIILVPLLAYAVGLGLGILYHHQYCKLRAYELGPGYEAHYDKITEAKHGNS